MKHVWILNHYAQEPGGPGGTRHWSLARHLPSYGWEASIIASGTEHKTGRQRLEPGEAKRLETYGNVPFLWLRGSPYKGNGPDRIRNMLEYTWRVLKPETTMALERPDAIIGSSVHPFAAWAGRRLARRYRVPFLFEVRDLWPETLIDMGRLSRRGPAAIALRKLERSLYESAERIIVLLPLAGDYIEPLGIAREKIVWIPNGVDLAGSAPVSAPVGRAGFTLMYFGAHGGANGLDNVIRAMRIIRDEKRAGHIRLRLIGDGPLKESLMALAEEVGASNVTFEAAVPKSRIPEIAAEADAFVFNLIDAPVFKFGISSNKIFDFMAARRPVIFCSNSANNPVADAGGGVTVPPQNPEALARAILELSELPPEGRAAMGKKAREHVEGNYSLEQLAARLADTLDSSLGKR